MSLGVRTGNSSNYFALVTNNFFQIGPQKAKFAIWEQCCQLHRDRAPMIKGGLSLANLVVDVNIFIKVLQISQLFII